MLSQKTLPAIGLGLMLFTGAAQAIPFQITSQLTGDPRPENPDYLVVDVTVAGDTTFTFELVDPPGQPKVNVTNSVSLSFDMTKLAGNFMIDDFLNAPTTTTAVGTSQLGAHLQSLNKVGLLTPTSTSGFAIGNYPQRIVTESVPEPSVLLLMGSGLVGVALTRRRSKRN